MPESVVATDLDFLAQTVPACLRERAQWVCWRYVERDGKPTKCPIGPTRGGTASSTDPATWGTFEQAVTALRRCSALEGVGFVFTSADPFAGLDLDKCINETGQIKPWALPIIRQLDSYAEISPSGTGVKVIVRAHKKGPRCKRGYEDGAIEMYDAGRFFTVTGQRLPDATADVEDRQVQYDVVYDLVFGAAAVVTPSPCPEVDASNNGRARLDDDDIIRMATQSRRSGAKFSALWAGRWNEYFNSHSEADSSVVFKLAFYTKDAGQIDRIFRRSRLMRDKWDERHGQQTYGEATIAKALATVTAQYEPKKKRMRTATASNGSAGTNGPPLSGEPPPGTNDPVTGRLILSTERTLPTAESFVRKFHQHPDSLTLRHYAGLLLIWRDNRYVEIEDDAMRNRLLPWLHAAVRMTFDPESNQWVAQDFPANPHTVKAALESIKAYAHLPATTASPSWLNQRDDRPDPREIIPCRTSLLHLPTMTHTPPTPAFFNVNALDYDHNPSATDALLGREWRRDAEGDRRGSPKAMVRIDRCLIDANWGSSSDVVYQFCRQSKFASVVMPSHGRYVGASSIPFSEYRRKRGDRVGLNWRIPVVTGKRATRHVVFDTNYWKSFAHARLAVPMGDPGCLSLFGQQAVGRRLKAVGKTGSGQSGPYGLQPKTFSLIDHRLLADHLTSEYRVKTEGRGRTVDEWKLRVEGLDNHWLDCLVGCAVAASIQGAILFGTDAKPAPRPRMRLSELQKARR